MDREARGVADIAGALRSAMGRTSWREVLFGIYAGFLVLCAVGLLILLLVGQLWGSALIESAWAQWPALILLVGVGLLADRYKITLPSGAAISAEFLIFFLSAAVVGPFGAMVVAIVCQLWFLRGVKWRQAIFITSALGVISGSIGLFYWFMTVHRAVSPVMAATYGLGAGLLFHFTNYLVFVPQAYLRRGVRPKELWLMGFQPFFVFHFFFLVMALGLVSIYRAYVPHDATSPTLYSTLLVMLCLLPVVGLIYAFRAYSKQRDLAMHNSRLAARNERLALEAVASHVIALDLKDDYTAQHSAAVAQWATDIATAMRLPEQQVHLIHLAGLLHDVGKIGMPDDLLKSPRHPDAEDWALIESHCFHGHKILSRVEQFQQLADVVLHHHERYDGNGYPHGLSGRDIPLESRIIAVADSYSAMISQRPYGPPLATIVAEAELEFRRGSQFDPEVVDYFLQLLHDRGESYRLGMKADFRVEVQDVKFLRYLPIEPEGAEAPPKPEVRTAPEREAAEHVPKSKPAPEAESAGKGETAWDARQKAQQRAGKRN